MFDSDLPDAVAIATVDDATLVGAIGGWGRAEAAAASRRLAAIAELVSRRTTGDVAHDRWSCDNWDNIAAEVAAALGVSHKVASGQMYLAVALRDRLPRTAALLAHGAISARLAATIVWHTQLIKDFETLQLVDKTLAEDAVQYGPLSANKTAQAIDAIIDRYDPGALRKTRASARSRDVVVDIANDESGTAAFWGRLYASDATVLNRRLTQMAGEVCDDDPRTLAQQRADALGVLAAGGERLACECDKPDCPAQTGSDQRATAVVIHVIADAESLTAEPDPHMSGEVAVRPITPEMTLSEALAPEPEPPGVHLPAGHILGGATVPAPLLSRLVAAGAKVAPLGRLSDTAPGPGYRPPATLDRFIRCRDMTCRFPNCDRPAELCDVDHTIPYPIGPTHPSNLKCLCRKHHLLKTFWGGNGGWRDRQLSDGTVVWTAPTGRTYTTRPGSRLLFPTLCLDTGELRTAATEDRPSTHSGLMMPQRRRTREQDRMYRIDSERALNNSATPRRSSTQS
ncbi:hypothetical protein A5634_01245 [Mycobacterium asiaticum]|uniref:HNH nuclease domain-containing protein n=1 Tax=Mycobacterium asiaticum TaxID=1790 RepID=A0A1A3P7Z8_MYCAS|nr:HNH endonuclease signature motif containing protein [Mycobacterium asiaticum]OBK28722.1 hypothetical protein A5634_01245 [Mycobacterium asiaticum]